MALLTATANCEQAEKPPGSPMYPNAAVGEQQRAEPALPLGNSPRADPGEAHAAHEPRPDTRDSWRPAAESAPLQTSHSDAEIAASIRQQLRSSAFLDASTIRISVTGGRATLSGEVATEAERALANQCALKGGALEVDNRLHVVANSVAL